MDKFVLAKLIFFCCCWNIFPQQEIMAYENLIDYSLQNIASQTTTEATFSSEIPESSAMATADFIAMLVNPHKTLPAVSHVSHFQCGVSTLRIYADEGDDLNSTQPFCDQPSEKMTKRQQSRQMILPESPSCPYTKASTRLQIEYRPINYRIPSLSFLNPNRDTYVDSKL